MVRSARSTRWTTIKAGEQSGPVSPPELHAQLAAIEAAPKSTEILRAVLHRAALEQIKLRGISLWEIPTQVLLTAFGHPPLKHRPDLRSTIRSIWPLPDLKPAHLCALDAFAVGLFVQTERLFNNF